MNNKEYTSPIGLTSQFRFCPNAFRVDMYKGCSFGCKYCFTANSNAQGHQGFGEAKLKKIQNLFYKAFETDTKNNLTIELLRHKTPLHCGGKSDPFQHKEFTSKLTYGLIELCNKYEYPICFSTKTASLPNEYFDILNPQLHAFQISILGWSEQFVKLWETNTPSSQDRLDFVKLLRKLGFWCSIRIQPLIDIDEAELLVKNASDIPSYITVEHLKLPADNNKALFNLPNADGDFVKSPYNMRNIEPLTTKKIDNIQRIKILANANGVPVGVGDNDLHHLSQSRCCCGIDTINDNFNNYLKYNQVYFSTSNEDINVCDLWCPSSCVDECFYSETYTDKNKTYKECVHKYLGKFPELLKNSSVEKQIFGSGKRKLF